MKIRNILLFYLALAVGLAAPSCSKEDSLHREFQPSREGNIPNGNRVPARETRKVLLLYIAGYNSLSEYQLENIRTLEENWLPRKGRNEDAVLIFSKFPIRANNYKTRTEPVLYQLYADEDNQTRRDTLKVYPKTTLAASGKTLQTVLKDVRELFPAQSYGMLFSSHATGWVPPGFYNHSDATDEPVLTLGTLASYLHLDDEEEFSHPTPFYYEPPVQDPALPAVRSIGHEMDANAYPTANYEISITNFAKAIPMQLDYLIFDVCLNGGIEIAHQLKDKVHYMIGSQTEILAEGMQYQTLVERLLKSERPDLKGVCEDYFNYYAQQSGYNSSATISLIDLQRLGPLTETCADLFEKYRTQLAEVDPHQVQGFWRTSVHWYYDLKDILVHAPIEEEDEKRLDEALSQCVLYAAHTPYFIGIPIRTNCGLSMYLPSHGKAVLDEYYQTLSWNQATNLVKE